VVRMLQMVRRINMRDETLQYATRLVRATRPESTHSALIKDMVECGGSPRATQALILGAKARAALDGRDEAFPEDIRAIALPAMHHRVLTNFHAEADNVTSRDLIRKLIIELPRPAWDEQHEEARQRKSAWKAVRRWLFGAGKPATA
jgi:MoxR-like ATPase